MDFKQWLRKNPDRAAAWAAVLVGALVLFFGWQGASRTEYPAEQLPYIISGGIGGALVVALGATLLISADLRDEWQKLDRIERRLRPPEEDDAPPSAVDEPGDSLADPVDAAASNGEGGPARRQLVARRSEG
jgi:hypothetical protein